MSDAILTGPDAGVVRRPGLRRLRQGFAALANHPDAAVDRRLRLLVSDDRQWVLLARLSSFDRSHLVAVHDTLVAMGCDDADILRAALLHDVGKADDRGRVRLLHRVVKVLGERWCPRCLERVARRDGGWLGHGVWLATRHAENGAILARDAGASERVCELIHLHDDSSAALGDAGLRLLRRADEGCVV